MPLNSELHRDSHDLSVFIASQGAQTLGVVAGLLGLASGLYIVLGWHSCTDVGFVPWLAMALMATVFALLQFSRFRAALWLLLWGGCHGVAAGRNTP